MFGFPRLRGLRHALAALAALLCLEAASPTAPGVAWAADGGVLFVSSFSPTIRWTESMVAAIEKEVAATGRPINLYVEFLDRFRLRDTPSDAEWADFLASKYRDLRPQAIIADGAPAIELMAELGPRQFGGAALIGIFPRFEALGQAANAVAVKVTTGPHIDQTVDMALAHWPDARKFVIVSDDTEPSHHLARVIRAALDRRTDRPVTVEHLFDRRLEDLESALAGLSGDSVVLYTHLSIDRTGRHFRPSDVAARLAQVSAAPIYVLFEDNIGSGVVGGYVNDARVAGRVAVRAAFDHSALAREFGGEPDPALGETHYSSRAIVDWRALRRWGIGEAQLPPDTEIRHRQPSLFEAYFLEALSGLVFIGVLSLALLLISILFVQRGRLARALRDANSRLEERVAARTRDIQQALAGEQTARQRLRTFVDMATHEFKTPLSIIDSSVQMLELLVDTEKDGVGRRLALIRKSARRVIDLVETCLAGERIDDALPVKLGSFAPAPFIQAVAERQRGHGASVVVGDLSALPASCVADPDLLGIALDALLDNARRYGPAGAPIDLTARRDGAMMVLSVGDRGPGVPESEAERVFEKYYRGVHSQGTSGTGIGLNLVKTIAELHGGAIVCRPREGGGTVFALTIPIDQPIPWDHDATAPAAAPSAGDD